MILIMRLLFLASALFSLAPDQVRAQQAKPQFESYSVSAQHIDRSVGVGSMTERAANMRPFCATRHSGRLIMRATSYWHPGAVEPLVSWQLL